MKLLKYKVKYGDFNTMEDEELVELLLTQRGVKDTHTFLNLSDEVLEDTRKFRNLKEAIYLVDKYVLNGGKVCIIVDCDADGYSSGAFTYMELKKLNPTLELSYVLHGGKAHGIIMNEVEKATNFDFDLLIVPDAGTNDKEQCKVLKEMGKEILILDHHDIDIINQYAVIINNQDESYPNPTLSGVGVVYKFFNFYEKCVDYPCYSNDMLDLVALGMIGDISDLTNFETRWLCLEGIRLLNEGKGNKFLQAIFQKNKGRIGEELNIKSMGWNIVPLINGVCRIATMEEKEDCFKALIEIEETREYQPRRKKKTDAKPDIVMQDLQTYMARVVTNIKGRQDRLATNQSKKLIDEVRQQHLDSNKSIIIEADKDVEATFTGYIANRMASYFKRPCLILKSRNDKEYGGSGRNYNLFEYEDFKSILLKSNLFTFVQGHPDAFGFKINKDYVKELRDYLDEQFINANIEDIYHVDYQIPVGRLTERIISQVGKLKNIWGNGLKAPLFCIKDIYVDVADIKLLGEKQNVLSITKNVGNNAIKFICLSNAKEVYNQMLGKSDKGLNKNTRTGKVCLEIIGNFEINEYEGRNYPQIQIVDFNVVEKEREIKF